MCVEWQLDAPWVHQDLQKADFIIIVNSEGAYKSYMSEYEKRNHLDSNLPSTGSSNLSSINSIRNKFLHEEHYDNIVMVYFEYTSEKYIMPDICPGFKYKLMKHFTDFLLHVHNLHRAENLSRFDLPLDGNHKKRPIGLLLVESIAEAVKFERDNPNWALKHFDRMYSHTSDESRHDSGLQADFSPDHTPEYEKPESWPSTNQAQLLKYLQGGETLTIYPSENEIQPSNAYSNLTVPGTKSRPYLNIDPNKNNLSKQTSPHMKSQSDSHIHAPQVSHTTDQTYDNSPDDFLPPDDFEDFDVVSNTVSEQMQNIVERYNKQPGNPSHQRMAAPSGSHDKTQPRAYDRDNDLYFLRVQSGEIPFISCSNDEVVSLGGESVWIREKLILYGDLFNGLMNNSKANLQTP